MPHSCAFGSRQHHRGGATLACLETGSSVSKRLFLSKSNGYSCRWGHLGLQVARRRGFTGLEAALQFACFFGLAGRLSHADSQAQRSISVCACVTCSCKLTQPEQLFHAMFVRIWEPAASQSWGHIGFLETSSRVRKPPFPSKSNGYSCRWGHLGLQVARRRGFTGLEQFAFFNLGLAARLRLFGAMPIPSHSGPSPCALAKFAVASSHSLSGCSMPCSCAFGSRQHH